MTIPAYKRVPNLTLRTVRRALNMSQSEFAAALRHAGEALGEPNTANKRLVQKWESGEHTRCQPKYARALQSVTRTPFEQLGFGTTGNPAGKPPKQSPHIGTPLESDPPLDEQIPPMGGPGDRLRFAPERPAQADPETIRLIEVFTPQLFDMEHHQASRTLAPTVGRHIDDIAALLSGTHREPNRHRLALAGGQAAALAGWLAFDLGDASGAHRYWDSALAAARYASNGPLLACIFTYMSYSAAERGDPSTAWQLAHTAAAHAGTDTRARSWMAARAAEEAALLGEGRAALAELDLAMTLGSELTPPAPDEPSVPWARFFYRSVLAAMAANVHGRLGNAQRARDAAALALRTLSSEKVKSRALILAEIACAAARFGEVELAVESAYGVLDLAQQLKFTIAQRKLRSLIALLSPHMTSEAVRELVRHLTSEPLQL